VRRFAAALHADQFVVAKKYVEKKQVGIADFFKQRSTETANRGNVSDPLPEASKNTRPLPQGARFWLLTYLG